jgi:hypothetical protein
MTKNVTSLFTPEAVAELELLFNVLGSVASDISFTLNQLYVYLLLQHRKVKYCFANDAILGE